MKEDYFASRASDWDKPEKIEMSQNFVGELLKHVTPSAGWKGLEIGAGTGLVGMQLLPRLRSLVFVDPSYAMLEVLKEKIQGIPNVEVLNGEVTDYAQNDVDFVFSNMSFHHIEDIDAALKKIYEITHLNAVVAIGDIRSEDGSFHRFRPIPHKGFDTEELAQKFENAGFRISLVRTYNVLIRERIAGKISEYEQFILIAKKQS